MVSATEAQPDLCPKCPLTLVRQSFHTKGYYVQCNCRIGSRWKDRTKAVEAWNKMLRKAHAEELKRIKRYER